jgi:hypothetical protein
MKNVIVIPKSNKKVIATIKSIKDRKRELREFILSGGKVSDFNPNNKTIA